MVPVYLGMAQYIRAGPSIPVRSPSVAEQPQVTTWKCLEKVKSTAPAWPGMAPACPGMAPACLGTAPVWPKSQIRFEKVRSMVPAGPTLIGSRSQNGQYFRILKAYQYAWASRLPGEHSPSIVAGPELMTVTFFCKFAGVVPMKRRLVPACLGRVPAFPDIVPA